MLYLILIRHITKKIMSTFMIILKKTYNTPAIDNTAKIIIIVYKYLSNPSFFLKNSLHTGGKNRRPKLVKS